MEVLERALVPHLREVVVHEQLELLAAERVHHQVAGAERDTVDRGLGRVLAEAGLGGVVRDGLRLRPCAARELRVGDGTRAAHALPLRRVVARVEVLAVESEDDEHLLAVERPAFLERAARLDLANEVGVTAGGGAVSLIKPLIRPQR